MDFEGTYKPIRENQKDMEKMLDSSIRYCNSSLLENGSLFVEELGIDVSKENAPIPESNGAPRVFLMRGGKVTTLKDEKMTVGSTDFWNAMLNGQVFAYPAGEKYPVQISMTQKGNMPPSVEITPPLDPEKLSSILPENDVALPKKPR